MDNKETESNDIINKLKQELMFDKYETMSDKVKTIKDLEEDPNLVFMYCQIFVEKKVSVFHYFKHLEDQSWTTK